MSNVITLSLYAISFCLMLFDLSNPVRLDPNYLLISSCFFLILGSVNYVIYQSAQSEKKWIMQENEKNDSYRNLDEVRHSLERQIKEIDSSLSHSISQQNDEFLRETFRMEKRIIHIESISNVETDIKHITEKTP